MVAPELPSGVAMTMAHEPYHPNEKPADHWRQLAQKALTEAQQTMDPRVERALRAIATEYLATAEELEVREHPHRTDKRRKDKWRAILE